MSSEVDNSTTLDRDVEAQQDVMIRFMEDVLSSIGGRESCSENEKRLGDRVGDAWERLNFEVRREPFYCHPAAFLSVLPIGALIYAAAVTIYMFNPVLGGIVGMLFALTAVLETLNYRRIVDWLFPKKQGINVAGIIRSRSEPKRRVIVNAHLDSAYEFLLWYYLGNWANLLLIIIILCAPIPIVGALLAITGWGGDAAVICMGWVGVGSLPLVLCLLFFRSKTPVPGAMDDLAGVAVLIGLGELIAHGEGLDSTEVVLLGSSSEEAGLRGAMHWAETHRKENADIPSYAIVVDNIYDERYLCVVERELLPGTRHDKNLVELAHRVAHERNLKIKSVVIPFGASDATAFTRNGVRATSLLAQDTSKLVFNYHTRHDTLDNVRPVSLSVTLQVVRDMIAALDRGA
jgi:acetylornithine deacetylase/succinyl-diaminopimelate desuccinylase-like protein